MIDIIDKILELVTQPKLVTSVLVTLLAMQFLTYVTEAKRNSPNFSQTKNESSQKKKMKKWYRDLGSYFQL